MKGRILILAALLLTGCTNFSAQQPYQTNDGEQLLISGNMPNGVLKLRINETLIINEPFLNQDKTLTGVFSTDFTNVYTASYKGKKVMARCDRKTNAFSAPDHTCEVFINGEYAANLTLR